MAGKPKRMSQIKQLLQLYRQGKKKKEIARILAMSKNTVKAYLEKQRLFKEDIGCIFQLKSVPVFHSKSIPFYLK